MFFGSSIFQIVIWIYFSGLEPIYAMWQLVVILILIFNTPSKSVIHNMVNVFLNIFYSLQNDS